MGKVIVAKGKAFWLLLSIFLLCVFQHFSISEFPPAHLCEGWAAGQMGFWWGWLEHGLEGTFRYRFSVILLLCC